MARLRRTAGLASAALLTFTLTACGGSDYCDLIESAEDDIGDVSDADFTDPEAMAPVQERLQEIADAAPDEVADQWQNSADAIQTIIDAEGDPANLTEDEVARFQDLNTEMNEAGEHAEEECDVDMNL